MTGQLRALVRNGFLAVAAVLLIGAVATALSRRAVGQEGLSGYLEALWSGAAAPVVLAAMFAVASIPVALLLISVRADRATIRTGTVVAIGLLGAAIGSGYEGGAGIFGVLAALVALIVSWPARPRQP